MCPNHRCPNLTPIGIVGCPDKNPSHIVAGIDWMLTANYTKTSVYVRTTHADASARCLGEDVVVSARTVSEPTTGSTPHQLVQTTIPSKYRLWLREALPDEKKDGCSRMRGPGLLGGPRKTVLPHPDIADTQLMLTTYCENHRKLPATCRDSIGSGGRIMEN